MAETAQLGKLVVQMLLDPSRWEAGAKAVITSAKALVSAVQQTANTVNAALSPAIDNSTKSVEENASAVDRMAGVWEDANGKLRDAAGKFVKDADALDMLSNAAGLTEEQLALLQKRADKIRFEQAREGARGLIDDFKEVGTVVQGVVVRGLQAATLAAAGLAAASTVVGAAFEQKMRQVGVIAGANAEQLNALTEEARRLGATTAFSASDAAEAMQVLASAGLKTEEVIAATGDALVLAGAGGTTLASSATIVASTLSQFSLDATMAGRVADVFAQATADSQFSVDDLGEALKYGGPVAASFGLSLEEAVAIMAQFRDLGLEGSMAGTALRSAFSQASQQTKANADTLAKYGLTLSDVNPQLHSFSEILATVGKAGMATSDAMVVFGVEAGGAVATLAEQAALGSTKLDDMTASLNAAATAGGTATAMYADMQRTVSGAFAELQSAAEEVLLTLFEQYGGSLAALLSQITAFVNGVAAAISDRSDDIRGALGGALALVGAYLDEHGADLAQDFASAVVKVAEFSVGVAKVATILADLIPVLDDIALTMGLVWVATKVAAFVSALSSVVSVLGAAKLGLRAFMVELTVASGGTYALVAAIGVLVVGLTALISRYVDAKDAAEQLKSAQDALAGKKAVEDQARVDALDAVLERQQAGIAASEQELAASGKLTAAKKAELDILRDLNGESAARLEAEGKLVEVAGELRTVASLVEDANLYDVADGYVAIETRITSLKAEASGAAKDIDELTLAVSRAKAAQAEGGSETAVSMTLTNALGEQIDTIIEAEARLADLQSRRKEATRQAVALENERGRVVADVLSKEEQAVKDAEAAKLRARGEAASQVMRTEQTYTDQTRDIRAKLATELAGLEGVLTDQITVEMAARRREVEQTYADQREKAKGNAAELVRLEQDLQGALTDLDEIEARKRAAVAAEAEQARADKVADERARLLDKLQTMQQADATEVERLEQEKADTLAGITGANVDLLLEIGAEYDKKIAAAREKETEAAQADADALAQRHKDNARKVASAVVDAFASVASAIGSALGSVYGLFESFASSVVDLFEKLTGFGFDLASLVSDTQSAQEDATDEGTTLSTQDAASSVIAGLFSEASAFLALFAEAAPVLLKGLSAGLPGLISEFLAAVPSLLAAVLAEVPTIVQAIADALPGLVQVVVAALPLIVDALLTVVDVLMPAVLAVLPDLINGLLPVAAAFILGVIQRLPDLISGLLDLLPDLITGILAQLPTLITALLASATDIIVALVKALPDLIGAILEALPDILIALIEGLVEAIPVLLETLLEVLPDLIIAIVDAIPDIINAVLGELPTIITMLVGLIPVLIDGIVAALPDLIPEIIGMAGEIATALVAAAPDIATALVMSVVSLLGSLPELAVSIGQAFVDGIKGAAEAIWDALVSIFSGLWDWLSGDAEDDSRRSRSAGPGAGAGIDVASIIGAAMATAVPELEAVGRASDTARRPAAGTTGQGSTARVQVVLNGRTIQDVMAVSDARGETTIRPGRVSGSAPVGVNRGRYNRYSK